MQYSRWCAGRAVVNGKRFPDATSGAQRDEVAVHFCKSCSRSALGIYKLNRSDVRELHYIANRANIASILDHGILSHQRASKLQHRSIANESVQDLRSRKRLPSGRHLHEYANLYFDARNPMMFALQQIHRELVVVRVRSDVLDLPGVMIADGNAARAFGTAFWGPEVGLHLLDGDLVYAEDWRDPDLTRQYEKKRIKCAEVLVPDRVPFHLIVGGYVSCQASAEHADLTALPLEITINEHLFFRGPRREGAA